MRLVLIHVRVLALEILRFPMVAVPTLLFPVGLYIFIAVPRADSQQAATFLMTSFAAFAVLAVAFFQFGVGVAMDRERPWERFLRILPISPRTRLAARVVTALGFAFAAALPAIIVAVLFTDAGLSAINWVQLFFILTLGAVPFAMLGLALGYWTTPKAALPLASLIYYPLAYVGSLWTLPQDLPSVVADISPFTPTRQWVDLLGGLSSGKPAAAYHWVALLAFTALFTLLATLGYRRDEGQKFR